MDVSLLFLFRCFCQNRKSNTAQGGIWLRLLIYLFSNAVEKFNVLWWKITLLIAGFVGKIYS